MNQFFGITLKILRSGRFSVLAVLLGLGLLFTAAGANAGGCAVPLRREPPPQFLSSARKRTENGASRLPSSDCGT